MNYQDLLDKAQSCVCPSVRLCLVQARKSWTRLLRLKMSDNLHSLLLFMSTEVHFMGVRGSAVIRDTASQIEGRRSDFR